MTKPTTTSILERKRCALFPINVWSAFLQNNKYESMSCACLFCAVFSIDIIWYLESTRLRTPRCFKERFQIYTIYNIVLRVVYTHYLNPPVSYLTRQCAKRLYTNRLAARSKAPDKSAIQDSVSNWISYWLKSPLVFIDRYLIYLLLTDRWHGQAIWFRMCTHRLLKVVIIWFARSYSLYRLGGIDWQNFPSICHLSK